MAIIDDAGITRHVMTTSLDTKEVATSVFSMVPVFKKTKVSRLNRGEIMAEQKPHS